MTISMIKMRDSFLKKNVKLQQKWRWESFPLCLACHTMGNLTIFKDRDWCKKTKLAQISPLLKNSQFLTYCNETLSKCLAHEWVISLEYQLDRRENKDFLSIVDSWASSVFFAPVSILTFESLFYLKKALQPLLKLIFNIW